MKFLDASLAMKCPSSSLPIRYAYSIGAKMKVNYESNEQSIRHFSNQSTLLLPWFPFWMGDLQPAPYGLPQLGSGRTFFTKTARNRENYYSYNSGEVCNLTAEDYHAPMGATTFSPLQEWHYSCLFF